jgi:hypothetical protein
MTMLLLMSDVSPACARCRRVAAVARGSVAYCMACNDIMDWADVISVVQGATEGQSADAPTPAAPAAREPVREPVLSGGGSDPTGSDPFSKRLL